MDESQMSRMYLAMVERWFRSLIQRLWRRGVMRSGDGDQGVILAVLVGALSFAYRERGRGNLHKLEAKIATNRQEAPVSLPGGQEGDLADADAADGGHDAGVPVGDDAAGPGDERASGGGVYTGREQGEPAGIAVGGGRGERGGGHGGGCGRGK